MKYELSGNICFFLIDLNYEILSILQKEADSECEWISFINESYVNKIKNNLDMNLDPIEKVHVYDIPMKTHYAPVDVNASMEDLMERVSNQNFVPVVDDMQHFIGIIRRKEIINYLYANSHLSQGEPLQDVRVLA